MSVLTQIECKESSAPLKPPATNHALLHQVGNWQRGTDYDALAAAISTMDLVITANNLALHLAGGLGVPAWALCPQAPLGPHWLADADGRSHWHPSVRIFRSQRLGDLRSLIGTLREELLHLRMEPADPEGMPGIIGPHFWNDVATAPRQV